ncbi:MAG: methyltransferase family protein [Bacteroidota bacterium]
MNRPPLWKHVRDILILPFTVTVVVPYFIYQNNTKLILDNLMTKITGAILFVFGMSLFIYAVSLFRKKGEGTLAPWTPTQKLIVSGPYRYCRNPMITGVLFMLTGESLFLNSTGILVWAGAFLLINTLYFVVYEEPSLEARFGDSYRHYKAHVPRWIPNIKPYDR